MVKQGKIHEIKLNNYDKLVKCNKYGMIYYRDKDVYRDYIDIIFSKNISVIEFINSKNPEIQNAKVSIINNTKVRIFETESYIEMEQKKIEGSAYFKCSDYIVCINAKGITNEEFIDIIRTVILEFI